MIFDKALIVGVNWKINLCSIAHHAVQKEKDPITNHEDLLTELSWSLFYKKNKITVR